MVKLVSYLEDMGSVHHDECSGSEGKHGASKSIGALECISAKVERANNVTCCGTRGWAFLGLFDCKDNSTPSVGDIPSVIGGLSLQCLAAVGYIKCVCIPNCSASCDRSFHARGIRISLNFRLICEISAVWVKDSCITCHKHSFNSFDGGNKTLANLSVQICHFSLIKK